MRIGDDRLGDLQLRLQRGEDGTEKPLSLSTAQIRRIAEARPTSMDALSRYLDDARLERFGAAILHEVEIAD